MNRTFTLICSSVNEPIKQLFKSIFCPCFKVLRDILKEVQSNMVPRSMLKEWALHTFPNATDYWTFRKMFTIQLALIGLAEFMLHLNRLNPEMLQIAQVPEWLDVMELISYLMLAFFHQIYMHPISPKHTCFSFCWPLSSCPATFAIWYRVGAGPQSAFESLLLDMCVKQAPHPMILICSFLTGGRMGG